MGHVRHQLHLHPLALHFRVHCFLKPLLNLEDLLPKRFEDAQVFLYGHIQLPLRNLVHGFQQDLIALLQLADIFPQNEIQHNGIHQRDCEAADPEAADQEQDYRVHQQQLDNRPVGILCQIHMCH